jgi:hypothetical protein
MISGLLRFLFYFVSEGLTHHTSHICPHCRQRQMGSAGPIFPVRNILISKTSLLRPICRYICILTISMPCSNKTAPFSEPATVDEDYIGYYNSPTFPQHLPTSVRCGRDSFAHAADTEVLTVRAGDTLELAHTHIEPKDWKGNQWYGCPEGRGSCDPDGTEWASVSGV